MAMICVEDSTRATMCGQIVDRERGRAICWFLIKYEYLARFFLFLYLIPLVDFDSKLLMLTSFRYISFFLVYWHLATALRYWLVLRNVVFAVTLLFCSSSLKKQLCELCA